RRVLVRSKGVRERPNRQENVPQYWPSLTLSYNNSRTGTDSPNLPLFGNYRETFSWRFGLSWTLFNGFTREQSQVSANVTHDVAVARAGDARRQVNAQLTQQLAALFTAYTQIEISGANVAAAPRRCALPRNATAWAPAPCSTCSRPRPTSPKPK